LHGREDGAPPPVELAAERRRGNFVRQLIYDGRVNVVHDLSDAGLVGAAAELALASGVGVTLDIEADVGQLFGEDQGRYLLAGGDDLLQSAQAAGVPARIVGQAGGAALAVAALFSIPLAELRAAHEGWLPRWMGEPRQAAA
jgi:phosphoribosylformylglycinamidine synthase